MVETRDSASSILIYPDTVWITGGKHFVEGSPLAVRLASTEYLSLTDESANGPGPDLPIHVWGHCVLSNYTANVLSAESTDECLRTKSKDN